MKTNIYQQHSEHTEWLNKLAFYKDELSIMQKRLDEIGAKNTANDVLKDVEHFQNQIIIQNNNVDTIKKHINREEKIIQANIAANPTASDHRKIEDHTEEREMVEGFVDNFEKIRKEYNTFLSKRM
jgi:hypothetical protein